VTKQFFVHKAEDILYLSAVYCTLNTQYRIVLYRIATNMLCKPLRVLNT